MSSNDPRGPRDVPPSPDHLELRGRVGGVTRIGPRAFALALAVIGAILIIVIYGVNKTTGTRTTETATTTASVAASPAPNPFANVPIVATPAPSSEPPPLLEPPTPVPNVEQRPAPAPVAVPANAAGNAANDAADRAAQMQQDQQAQQARDAAEKARRERIDAAYRSQILAGGGEQAGSGGGALGFAGNGGGAPAQIAAQVASGLGGGGGGFAGNGPGAANGLMGRNVPDTMALGAQATPDPNAFLAGPVGQYGTGRPAVVAADVSQTTSALPANANGEDYLSSGRTAARSAYQLTAGAVIPASLVTGLDSEVPGIVIGQVREDVYDTKTGKYKLIPRGTRLVGVYKSGIAYGQSRVLVTWRRMIFPDTTNVDLENFSGNDQEGYAGFGGTVDNHTGRLVGAALLSSVIAGAYALTQRNTGSVLQNPTAGQAVGSAAGQQVTQVTSNLIQKQTNIPPVVYVPKGYPFLVVVDRDVVFPGPYRDL